jgi:hypothetical protein
MYSRAGESRLVTTLAELAALDEQDWADTPAAFLTPPPEPETAPPVAPAMKPRRLRTPSLGDA